MMRYDFFKHLNPVKATEFSLYSSTYIIAEKFNIPIILWGENSAYEYGSGDENLKGSKLTYEWRKNFGNLPKNFKKISKGVKNSQLFPYISHLKKNNKKIKEIFLGYYFYWDPIKT